MTNVSLFGRGHGVPHGPKPQPPPPGGPRMLVRRQWRLGDIVMCEPACRILSRRGMVTFSTRDEYHPIVRFFSENPPRTMSYPPPDRQNIVIADEVFDLDGVTLDHPGFGTKVDAFLAACGIDPSVVPRDAKLPRIEPSPRCRAWARTRLSDRGILDRSLVAVVRQSHDAGSPRSLPPSTLDDVVIRLTADHDVIYIGAMPVEVGITESIHNMTGCTPDVTFAAGIVGQCRLLVTVDTGLMHVAGAMGIPMVVVMGPTRPDDLATIYDRTSILDVGPECSPCYDRGCDSPCLHRVDPMEIYHLCVSRVNSPDAPTEVHRLPI